MNSRIYLNEDWLFTRDYEDRNHMEKVRIPHTCVETSLNYFDESIYQMICGYERSLTAPEEWRGKHILLTFEGAAHVAEVYVNHELVTEHRCGYTGFTVDISEQLQYGADNLLEVRLNTREDSNIPPFGYVVDYMTYGGIYRDVYLEVKSPVYLADVFVKSTLDKPEHMVVTEPWKKADVHLCTEVTLNHSAENLYVRQSIDGELLGESKLTSEKMTVEYELSDCSLWDVDTPHLHHVKTELIEAGQVIDERITRTGFRRAEFLRDGFYLNGRKLKLRGLNRHQSYPYVGYAMPKGPQVHDARILKNELGLNAVRTSHYPQSHYFIDSCDELGLLVFTEMPGWQHIGDEAWKNQAISNIEEMILQYRNHTSIILWGVRINESQDDDEFYTRTNEVAHRLDDTRPTGGVRAHKKSSLLEDVYTYNDFLHDGTTKGCDRKCDVTSDTEKPYLISEFNGHMYPTKNFDCEEHRVQHAIRHANVLNEVAGQEDIAGCFGWCMFDYNTHKDFGSGDRICYHGVLDMFRNPKLAAAIYASQAEEQDVLELSSSMDIGEHPGCNRGDTYIFTNADSVRMYKNDIFIKEYTAADSPFTNMKHGPILIDDFIGDQIEKKEKFTKKQAAGIKQALNACARYGLGNLPLSVKLIAVKMVLLYHMKPQEAVTLYNRYIGDWGGTVTSYRFEAIRNNQIVKTVSKEPMTQLHLNISTDRTTLEEQHSYDVADIRICAMDENDNVMTYYQEPVRISVEGPLELIGPDMVTLRGGMAGTYVKTTGVSGTAKVRFEATNVETVELTYETHIITYGED